MGNNSSTISRDGPGKILIQGLYQSGKTSLVYALKHGKAMDKETQVYFNLTESIDLAGMEIICWDLGGREAARPFANLNYRHATAFVYVIDGTDKERLDEALDDLVEFVLLDRQTKNSVIMVLANKQDLPDAMTDREVEEALKKKYTFSKHSSLRHTVLVRPCSTLTLEGVHQAFEEMAQQMELKKAGAAEVGLVHPEGSDVTGTDGSGKFVGCGIKFLLQNPKSYLRNLFP